MFSLLHKGNNFPNNIIWCDLKPHFFLTKKKIIQKRKKKEKIHTKKNMILEFA